MIFGSAVLGHEGSAIRARPNIGHEDCIYCRFRTLLDPQDQIGVQTSLPLTKREYIIPLVERSTFRVLRCRKLWDRH